VEGVAVKLSKNVRYLVRVRDYETIHVEVGAEISHYDLGIDDAHWADLFSDPREQFINRMHEMLATEVDRIAREELAIIAGWSEISPNLAEDFLSVESPTTMQRNHHASKKTGSHATSGGGLRSSAARKVSTSATTRREHTA
jgi:hypothetical protein